MTWCRQHVDRPGDEVYLHLIRHPEDPSRSPRPAGGQVDRMPHRTLDKRDPEAVRSDIVRHLSDGEPRTFNRLTVELWDITADIAFDTVADEALWSLVGEYIEHTVKVPILFRLLPHLRNDAELRQGHVAPTHGSQLSLAFSALATPGRAP